MTKVESPIEQPLLEGKEEQQKKEKGPNVFVIILSKYKYLILFLFLCLSLFFWMMTKLRKSQDELKLQEKQKGQIITQYEFTLDSLHSQSLLLTAKTFSWAIRSELLRGNKEQVNLFFNDFVRNPDILKLYFIDSKTSIVELSTDKKDEGTVVGKYNKEQVQTIVFDSTSFEIITPIAGLNDKLGVFVIKVDKLKH